MADLPSDGDLSGDLITQGQFKTAIKNQRQFLEDNFGITNTKASVRNTLDVLDKDKSYNVTYEGQLLEGDISLTNTVEKLTHTNYLHTGTGGSTSPNIGIGGVDFTVSSNGTGHWLDRTTNQVKNDAGTVVDSGEIDLKDTNALISWEIKERGTGTDTVSSDWIQGNSLLGVTKYISSNSTSAEQTDANGVTAITSTGLTLGTSAKVNELNSIYLITVVRYTKIKWGLTNHGKLYVTAYNPQSLEEMSYYEGSGTAGHEIPTGVGRELAFSVSKSLTNVTFWQASTKDYLLYLEQTDGGIANTYISYNADSIVFEDVAGNDRNGSGNSYILYGFANAYHNADGDLVGTRYAGTYIGAGASGNEIETPFMSSTVVMKSLGLPRDWYIFHNKRNNFDSRLNLNNSNAENSTDYIDVFSDGIKFSLATDGINGASEEYLYIVSADSKLNGGGAYVDIPSDTTNLQITNGKAHVQDGLDSKVIDIDGTIDTSSLSEAGDYYVIVDNGGI